MSDILLTFKIYVFLNSDISLNDRTAAGIANAMRCSKDKAIATLTEMVADGYLITEPIGNYKIYYINREYVWA